MTIYLIHRASDSTRIGTIDLSPRQYAVYCDLAGDGTIRLGNLPGRMLDEEWRDTDPSEEVWLVRQDFLADDEGNC